ncbi:unnamed protein product, partial [Iphiclides podalirius]
MFISSRIAHQLIGGSEQVAEGSHDGRSHNITPINSIIRIGRSSASIIYREPESAQRRFQEEGGGGFPPRPPPPRATPSFAAPAEGAGALRGRFYECTPRGGWYRGTCTGGKVGRTTTHGAHAGWGWWLGRVARWGEGAEGGAPGLPLFIRKSIAARPWPWAHRSGRGAEPPTRPRTVARAPSNQNNWEPSYRIRKM